MPEWEIEAKPAYSVLKVKLSPGESVTSEAGAMMLMRGDVSVSTSTGGGLLGALVRKVAAGETVFVNTYTTNSGGEVWFVPSIPGDIEYIPLNGESYVVQDTSYLAHHGDIRLGVAWRGMRGLLAEGEMVWLKVEGTGGVWVSSFGAMEKIELQPGERITVDNFHFVAMPSNVRWEVRKFGGFKSFILGGEGLVFDVTGPAKVYLQTRIMPPLVKLLQKYFRR